MVLGINSTDGLGNPSTFTPSPGPYRENYSILGEGVSSSRQKRLGGPALRKAGTSFATLIAAGLSATLLYYAKARAPKSEESRRAGSVGELRAMLSAMTESRAGYGYIVPWNIFDRKPNEYVYETLYDLWKDAD
jgi:hypothetical protein